MEFSINMKLQIEDNHLDMCSDSLHWVTSYYLDQKFSKWIDINIVAVPILCNPYSIKTKLECMCDNNILKMHLKRC